MDREMLRAKRVAGPFGPSVETGSRTSRVVSRTLGWRHPSDPSHTRAPRTMRWREGEVQCRPKTREVCPRHKT